MCSPSPNPPPPRIKVTFLFPSGSVSVFFIQLQWAESQGFRWQPLVCELVSAYIILAETWSWEKLLESPNHSLWLIHGEMEAQSATMMAVLRPPGNLKLSLQFFRTVQISTF